MIETPEVGGELSARTCEPGEAAFQSDKFLVSFAKMG
jgi:hypothetical protein